MNFQISASLQVGLLLVSFATLPSCRVTSHAVTQSRQTQQYDRLEIIYRAHPASGPLFSSIPKPAAVTSDIIQAAAIAPEPSTSFQNMCWSKAELRIECPHPDGRADYARVTLHFKPVACGHDCERTSWGQRIEERQGIRKSRTAEFRQRWFYDSTSTSCDGETFSELDLPKFELDAILAELNEHGFFTEHGQSSDSESQLEVRLNRRWTSKFWNYEPRLDGLATRVYEQGTLKTHSSEQTSSTSSRFAPLNLFKPAARSQ